MKVKVKKLELKKEMLYYSDLCNGEFFVLVGGSDTLLQKISPVEMRNVFTGEVDTDSDNLNSLMVYKISELEIFAK